MKFLSYLSTCKKIIFKWIKDFGGRPGTFREKSIEYTAGYHCCRGNITNNQQLRLHEIEKKASALKRKVLFDWRGSLQNEKKKKTTFPTLHLEDNYYLKYSKSSKTKSQEKQSSWKFLQSQKESSQMKQ